MSMCIKTPTVSLSLPTILKTLLRLLSARGKAAFIFHDFAKQWQHICESHSLEELKVDGNPINLDMSSGLDPEAPSHCSLDVSLYDWHVKLSVSAAAAPDTTPLQSRVWGRKTTQC